MREASPYNSVTIESFATSTTKQAPDSLLKSCVFFYSFIQTSPCIDCLLCANAGLHLGTRQRRSEAEGAGWQDVLYFLWCQLTKGLNEIINSGAASFLRHYLSSWGPVKFNNWPRASLVFTELRWKSPSNLVASMWYITKGVKDL